MNIRLIPCAGLLAVTLVASGAHAATVKWMLQGVQFDDGGTATGSLEWASA